MKKEIEKIKVQVLISADKVDEIDFFAKRSGLSRSAWCCSVLMRAVRFEYETDFPLDKEDFKL